MAVERPVTEPDPVPRPSAKRARRVIELEETSDAPMPIELASAWEFVTFQPSTEAPVAPEAVPEPEAAEKLELADPWEFVQWQPEEEQPEPEPEAEPASPKPERDEGS